MFEIGQHVLCINDEHQPINDPLYIIKPVKKGLVYTIKDMCIADISVFCNKLYYNELLLILEEASCHCLIYKDARGFNHRRFKPLDKFNMDVFYTNGNLLPDEELECV